ncbi:hypothetical protein D9M68_932030 [compost metagenome]
MLAGASTHKASAMAVVPSVACSSQGGTFNLTPGNADWVNAGITRPAITHSIITISARPAYRAFRGGHVMAPDTLR